MATTKLPKDLVLLLRSYEYLIVTQDEKRNDTMFTNDGESFTYYSPNLARLVNSLDTVDGLVKKIIPTENGELYVFQTLWFGAPTYRKVTSVTLFETAIGNGNVPANGDSKRQVSTWKKQFIGKFAIAPYTTQDVAIISQDTSYYVTNTTIYFCSNTLPSLEFKPSSITIYRFDRTRKCWKSALVIEGQFPSRTLFLPVVESEEKTIRIVSSDDNGLNCIDIIEKTESTARHKSIYAEHILNYPPVDFFVPLLGSDKLYSLTKIPPTNSSVSTSANEDSVTVPTTTPSVSIHAVIDIRQKTSVVITVLPKIQNIDRVTIHPRTKNIFATAIDGELFEFDVDTLTWSSTNSSLPTISILPIIAADDAASANGISLLEKRKETLENFVILWSGQVSLVSSQIKSTITNYNLLLSLP